MRIPRPLIFALPLLVGVGCAGPGKHRNAPPQYRATAPQSSVDPLGTEEGVYRHCLRNYKQQGLTQEKLKALSELGDVIAEGIKSDPDSAKHWENQYPAMGLSQFSHQDRKALCSIYSRLKPEQCAAITDLARSGASGQGVRRRDAQLISALQELAANGTTINKLTPKQLVGELAKVAGGPEYYSLPELHTESTPVSKPPKAKVSTGGTSRPAQGS